MVTIPEKILKVKQEVEAEFYGTDANASWSRGESNVSSTGNLVITIPCITKVNLIFLSPIECISRYNFCMEYG